MRRDAVDLVTVGPVLYTSEGNIAPSVTAPDDLFESESEREKSLKLYCIADFAADGFYYYPRDPCDCSDTVDDRVRSFCCGIELIHWKKKTLEIVVVL